tara:strand:+ start:704 stop:1027 length:324 start_codon:yes stop_codon:yes gene_type:complete
MSFETTMNRGFMMKFDNGFKISVQFGPMNYCDKKGSGDWDEPAKQDHWEATSAEIAVFDPDGNMIEIREGDTVSGWNSTNDVAAAIFMVSTAIASDSLSNKFKELKF